MKRVFRILFPIVFGAMAATVVFLPFLPFFCVYDAAQQRFLPLCFEPTPLTKTEFVISYTHSVNKGLIHDFYTIESDNTIQLNTTRFLSYGAGMRELEPNDGVLFVKTADYMELQNLHIKMPYLLLSVGLIANHSLECNRRNYRLTDYFLPQTRVIIGIKNLSIFNYLFAKFFNIRSPTSV